MLFLFSYMEPQTFAAGVCWNKGQS